MFSRARVARTAHGIGRRIVLMVTSTTLPMSDGVADIGFRSLAQAIATTAHAPSRPSPPASMPSFVSRGSRHEPPPAPIPPSQKEKLLYLRRWQGLIVGGSLLALASAAWSIAHLLPRLPALVALVPFFAVNLLYFTISLAVSIHRSRFHLTAHVALVQRYAQQAATAGVDILLPTAGEELTVLANTWNGVRALCAAHQGSIAVYVLDDSARKEVRDLADIFGFCYSVRAERGWYKKAGNLRHGYTLSRPLGHQFMVIFDADFRPRTDFLSELLPYFFDDLTLGLVQSPQYFDVRKEQIWLQRGAGAVQEFFYRYSQVARDSHEAAICVGTNAIYRRAALDTIGGTALIEHSEDVHTGFNLRMAGWTLRYVPLVLSKGVCPDSLEAFFKQQYRWCMGSMSLLCSRKFWHTRMQPLAWLSYWSGFGYYISTALALLWAPLVPLAMLVLAPQVVSLEGYLPLLPAVLYSFAVWPLWHRCDYGTDAWAVRHAYSWAHLFALVDVVRRRPMGWSPTGGRAGGTGGRYRAFRILQVLIGVLPNLAWAVLAGVRVVAWHEVQFLPMGLVGSFAAYTAIRVACYRQRPGASTRYSAATGDPTTVLPLSVLSTLSMIPPAPTLVLGSLASLPPLPYEEVLTEAETMVLAVAEDPKDSTHDQPRHQKEVV